MPQINTKNILIVAIFLALLAGGTASPPIADFPTGLLPPTEEEKAWAMERGRVLPPPPEKVLEALPRRHINLEHLPPVGRQIIGSCASWSVVYYVKGWQEAKEHGITRPFPEEHILSPAFVFQYVGISVSGGSSFEANIEFLERHGTSTFEEYPESRYLFQEEPPPVDLWKSAASRRAAPDSMGSIPTNTQEGLDTLKAHLVGGELASTAAGVYKNFDEYPQTAPGVNNSVFYAEGSEGFRDHHALTIIGYDDDITYHNGTEERQGAFLAVNSWGTTWGVAAEEGGERGYIWLAYEYFLNNSGSPRLFDFYTLGNMIDYEPRHFAILDIDHPRRAEINIGFLAGPREDGNAQKIVVNRGLRPLNMRFAIDVTDLVADEDEAFWLSTFDVVLPEFGPRRPAVIHEFTVEQEGRQPVSAQNNIPFQPVDQLSQVIPRAEWLAASPTYRHDTVYPPDGLTTGEGGTRVSVDIGDIFGDGEIDIATFGMLMRLEDGKPVVVGEVPLGNIALGDYDNDGLPDLAVWGQFSDMWQVRLYRNQGDGKFQEESVFPPVSAWGGELHWVDFNGNGRLDLVTTTVNDSQLYINRGGGVFRESDVNLPTAPFHMNMIVDFDQDGLMDFGGWRNLGNGEWAPPPWRETAPIAWGDYNGDGLLDAAIIERNNTITIYRNDGDGNFTAVVQDLPAYNWTDSRMRWADVNNNGLLDLVVKGNMLTGFYVSTEARTQVYTQIEDGIFHRTGLNIHGHGLGGALIVADLDQDGDVDFLSGGYPSVEGTTFSASKPREVRYTESLFADEHGRATPNAPPAAPTNPRAEVTGEAGEMLLLWDDSEDDRTPPRSMRYQIRVGKSTGGHEVVSSARSLAEIPSLRLSPAQAGILLNNLTGGTHYWSVRAVDGSGAFSPWTPENTFHVVGGVRARPPIDPNEDGILDSGDVATVRSLIGNNSPANLARADIDGSGSITRNDVEEIARMLIRPGMAPTPPWIAVVDENGAELTRDDVTVTVPRGAIVGDPVVLRLTRGSITQFDTTARNITYYRLEGIPYSLSKPIDVSLYNSKWWEEGWSEPLLCIGEEGFSASRGQVGTHYSFMEPDAYQNNYFHFQIHPLDEETGKTRVKDFVEGEYSRDFFALGGYMRYTTPHFTIAFPGSFDTEIVENLANDLEQAHARFQQSDIGFSYAARTSWPVSVMLKDLGMTLYGQSYASIRGPNYAGLEFNTRRISDPVTRRVTAFHEFFHIVETFYDPRNRYSVAKRIAPYYTLSEMVATWIEELAVSNPQAYVPSEWETNRFALFDRAGWDLPSSITGSNRHAGTVGAHGYGLSPAIRYLVRRHDPGIVRRIYQNIRIGQDWITAIGNATGDSTYAWHHGFMTAYILGEIYPFSEGDLLGIAAGRLRLNTTRTVANFETKMPNLSSNVYAIQVEGTAPQGFIKEENRLGFRLEGPERSRLSIHSMIVGESRELVEFAPWDDGVSRYLTDSVRPILGQSQSAYFALVTHDKARPRHDDPEEFKLTVALLEDRLVEIGSFTSPGMDFLNGKFPTMASDGLSIFVPAASEIEATRFSDFPAYILSGTIWEDPENAFDISVNLYTTESTRLHEGETWTTSGIQHYELTVHERRGPNPEDLITIENITSASGNFTTSGHIHNGKSEWIVTAHYTVTVTRTTSGGATEQHHFDQWVPVVIFSAQAF